MYAKSSSARPFIIIIYLYPERKFPGTLIAMQQQQPRKKRKKCTDIGKEKEKTGQPVPAAPMGVKGVVIGLSLMIIKFDDSRTLV
jgi:hypothetical protein